MAGKSDVQIGYIRPELAADLAPLIDGGTVVRCKVSEVTGGAREKASLDVMAQDDSGGSRQRALPLRFAETCPCFPDDDSEPRRHCLAARLLGDGRGSESLPL
jgi:hypothetical protein